MKRQRRNATNCWPKHGLTRPACRGLLACFLLIGIVLGSPAVAELRLTHLANEGFLVEGGGRKVLVDALFTGGVPGYSVIAERQREALQRAASPFDDIDLALTTHFHPDHFDAAAVVAFLRASPTTRFISTAQAVARLRDLVVDDRQLLDRVEAIVPDEGARHGVVRRGLGVTVLNLHHGRGGDPPVENLGFLVEQGGMRWLHMGDTEVNREEMAVHRFIDEAIDLALIPYWLLMSAPQVAAVEAEIGPRVMGAMHLPAPEAPVAYFEPFAGREELIVELERWMPEGRVFSAPGNTLTVAAPPRQAVSSLSRAEAIRRRQQVADVRYTIEVDLTDPESFRGHARIEFAFRPVGAPLTIDFSRGSIEALSVNGVSVTPEYNGEFLTLQEGLMRQGENLVQIAYRGPYSNDGNGLYRFEDPADGRTYVYSYLWPYYANRLFPCFDQPDLKAPYELAVIAPPDWLVVSTQPEASRAEVAEGRRRWEFPPTPPLSTYIYSLHAGPYRIWEAGDGEIPLRLLARQSLADRVDPEAWFGVTRQGLDFFSRYFDIPFPFAKYDQLLVPDFNIGAMENAAAVTFRESYLWREKPSRSQREALSTTILHEMAHMWFGDLVTKEWWNGLWLNESFATLMAFVAWSDLDDSSDAWHRFYLAAKRSAYAADQLVTTHPVDVPVADSGSFFSIFDSISYGKGASILRQLQFLVGEENFRAGVSSYLKEHAWGNTRLDDFVAAVGSAAQRELTGWADDWLYRAGVNRLQAEWACDNGRLREARVVQSSAAGEEVLREHRLQAAVWLRDTTGKLQIVHQEPFTVRGESTSLDHWRGLPCPDLIDVNHGDEGFALLTLDRQGLATVSSDIGQFEDPLMRSRLWAMLWDTVQSGRGPLPDWLALAERNLESEPNDYILRQILRHVTEAVEILARRSDFNSDLRTQQLERIEKLVWQGVEASSRASDRQRAWLDSYLGVAATPSGLQRLAAWLQEPTSAPEVDLDQDRRWQALTRLASFGHPIADALMKQEAARDASYSGRVAAIAASAVAPDAGVKSRWIDRLADPDDQASFGIQQAVMAALFPAHQVELQRAHVEQILRPLPAMAKDRDGYFLDSYTRSLLEVSCDGETIEAISETLERVDRRDATVHRALLEVRQEAERCLAVRLNG